MLSLPKKIILLNAKVDSHRVSSKTEAVLQEFLTAHPGATRDVKVRINQWTPVGELKRLTQNKRVEWYFRVFPGIPVTLWSSLTGRVLGGDHYNPYTNTIHLFSDDSAIALHEAGHAVDFAGNPSPGLYAVGRILVPLELTQEQTASDIAIQHLKENKDREGELHAYQTLYPAFGTYGGDAAGVPYGSYIGAGAGHVIGFWQRHERRLGYQALDEAHVQDYVVTGNRDVSGPAKPTRGHPNNPATISSKGQAMKTVLGSKGTCTMRGTTDLHVCPLSQLVDVKNSRGKTTRYSYDSESRLIVVSRSARWNLWSSCGSSPPSLF